MPFRDGGLHNAVRNSGPEDGPAGIGQSTCTASVVQGVARPVVRDCASVESNGPFSFCLSDVIGWRVGSGVSILRMQLRH